LGSRSALQNCVLGHAVMSNNFDCDNVGMLEPESRRKSTLTHPGAIIVGALVGIVGFFVLEPLINSRTSNSAIVSFDLDCVRDHLGDRIGSLDVATRCEVGNPGHGAAVAKAFAGLTPQLRHDAAQRTPYAGPVMSSAEPHATRGDMLKRVAATFALSVALKSAPAAHAEGVLPDKFKFPPIPQIPGSVRCRWQSSAMGQANAARDQLFDLRECNMAGTSAAGYDISGALLAKGDFSKVNFKETQMSKLFAPEAKFDGCDFTNAIVDRGYFKDASFKDAIFKNALVTGSSFESADLTNADFTDAAIAQYDLKKVCRNPKLQGTNPVTGADTRISAGCIPRDD